MAASLAAATVPLYTTCLPQFSPRFTPETTTSNARLSLSSANSTSSASIAQSAGVAPPPHANARAAPGTKRGSAEMGAWMLMACEDALFSTAGAQT